MATCKKCGNEFSDDFKFCPKCGEPNNVTVNSFCPYCGTKVEDNPDFCPMCGKNLKEKPQPKTKPFIKVNGVDVSQIAPKKETDPKKVDLAKQIVSLILVSLTFIFIFLPIFAFGVEINDVSATENYSILFFLDDVKNFFLLSGLDPASRQTAHWTQFGKIASIFSLIAICAIFIAAIVVFVIPFIKKDSKFQIKDKLFSLAIAAFVIYIGTFGYIANYVCADPNTFTQISDNGQIMDLSFEISWVAIVYLFFAISLVTLLICLRLKQKNSKSNKKNYLPVFGCLGLLVIFVGFTLVGADLFDVEYEVYIGKSLEDWGSLTIGPGNLFYPDINCFLAEAYWYMSIPTIIAYCAMFYYGFVSLCTDNHSKMFKMAALVTIGVFAALSLFNFISILVAAVKYSDYVFNILDETISQTYYLYVSSSYSFAIFLGLLFNLGGAALLFFGYFSVDTNKEQIPETSELAA